MKLHTASRQELRRVALFSAAGTLLLITATGLMTDLHHRVILGALGGYTVAVLNFALMCLTIQKAVSIGNPKTQQAFIQGSYNARLVLQALWVVTAFVNPHINVFAAATPLLFPGLIIFLQRKMHKKTD